MSGSIRSFGPECRGLQPFGGTSDVLISDVPSGTLPTLLDLLKKLDLDDNTEVSQAESPDEELMKIYRSELAAKNSDARIWKAVERHVKENDLGLEIRVDEEMGPFVYGDISFALGKVRELGINTTGFLFMGGILAERAQRFAESGPEQQSRQATQMSG